MKYLWVVSVAVVFTGCASSVQTLSPGRLGVGLPGVASSLSVDPETEQQSEMMASFLKGEVAFNNEDLDLALQYFQEADLLAAGPIPVLHRQLALLALEKGDLQLALDSSTKLVCVSTEADDFLLHGGILQNNDKGSEAVSYFERAVELSPEQVDLYFHLAAAYMNVDASNKAIETLRRLMLRRSEDLLVYFYLGLAYEMSGDYAKASETFSRLHEKWPENALGGLHYVRLLVRGNQRAKAVKVVESLSKQSPFDTNVRRVQAILSLPGVSNKKLLAALVFLDRKSFDYNEIRLELALRDIESRQFKSAQIHLLLILAKRPEDSKVRYYYASLLAAGTRQKSAIRELEKIASDQKMFIESRVFASFIYRELENLGGAESVLKEAIEVKNTDLNLWFYLIDVLREAKKYSQAVDVISDALEQFPDDDKLHFMNGIILHDLGKERKATAAMERTLEINPMHTHALNYLAYNLAEEGEDLTRAHELVSRALELHPDDGYFLDTLGWIYYKQGEYEKALSTLARAVRLTGGDIVVMEHYADCLIAVDQFEKALRFYNAAVNLGEENPSKEEQEAFERIEKKVRRLLKDRPELRSILAHSATM
ncbi:MAG: tetratricopeptide repeat protein [Bdellovibrionales bacterium]|nr:tetratricopeptide repeat protein [Bdellovibrionales bacterium]